MSLVKAPYLLFVGDVSDLGWVKTAAGLRDWAPERCLGQHSLAGGYDLGLTEMTPAQAAARGAATLVIGAAPDGGEIPAAWLPTLLDALEAGLDLASGLHQRLRAIPVLAAAAARLGRQLIDVRDPPATRRVGDGRRRTGRRLLTVGTDCAVGKKYTALVLTRALRERRVDADFRATGQTGILITGAGVPIDAVVSDFLSGAAEDLSPDAAAHHWDLIEGQGSLFHPSYAAVTLGLLHGSQPDVMILCHAAHLTTIGGLPDYPLPTLADAIRRYEEAASLTNPGARVVAVSLNTAALDDTAATAALAAITEQVGLPAFDPMRTGVADFLDASSWWR